MVNDIQSRRGHAVQTGRPRWFRKTESSVTQIYEGGRGGGAAASISHSCFNTINLGNLIDTVIEFMYRVCSVTTITIVIHSIGTRRTRRFLAVLRSFFHSSLLCTLSCHPSPPILFHRLSPHLAIYFLVYLSILLFPNSYVLPFWESSSILCKCPNQRNLFKFIVSITFSCHPSPPNILPSSLTSSCHLFLGLPLNLVPRFIYNTVLGILSSSILCTCPNQRNLFNLTVSIIVGFLTLA